MSRDKKRRELREKRRAKKKARQETYRFNVGTGEFFEEELAQINNKKERR